MALPNKVLLAWPGTFFYFLYLVFVPNTVTLPGIIKEEVETIDNIVVFPACQLFCLIPKSLSLDFVVVRIIFSYL